MNIITNVIINNIKNICHLEKWLFTFSFFEWMHWLIDFCIVLLSGPAPP